jgi:hypothetical protein
MFWKNKTIKQSKQLATPLVVSIQPNVMNPNMLSGCTSMSSQILYASASTISMEGLWDLEREMKRAERKSKIEELFPELISTLNNETETAKIDNQNGFG